MTDEISSSDNAAELAALPSLYLENEYVCLRMDKNESFCLTSTVVLFSFLMVNDYGPSEVLIGLFGAIYAGICWQKAVEYRRFFTRILNEIKETEKTLKPSTGLWANRLYSDQTSSYNIGRTVFWPLVNLGAWGAWCAITVYPNLPIEP